MCIELRETQIPIPSWTRLICYFCATLYVETLHVGPPISTSYQHYSRSCTACFQAKNGLWCCSLVSRETRCNAMPSGGKLSRWRFNWWLLSCRGFLFIDCLSVLNRRPRKQQFLAIGYFFFDILRTSLYKSQLCPSVRWSYTANTDVSNGSVLLSF